MRLEITSADAPSQAAWMRWAGWTLTILPSALLAFSASGKFQQSPQLVEMLGKFGWAADMAPRLGALELACVALYLIPNTAVLGCILLTGYLGGAVATHVRVGDAFHVPIVLGVLLWGGLFLREPRLRALLPWRRVTKG